MLYHYQTDTVPTIYEDNLTSSPSSTSQERLNLTNYLITRPQLKTDEGISQHQPLAAIISVHKGMDPQIYVFWADGPIGHLRPSDLGSDTSSGYNILSAISRMVNNNT